MLPANRKSYSEVLREIHDTLWENEANNPWDNWHYTEAEMNYATKIFMHAIQSRAVDNKIITEPEQATEMWKYIRDFIIKWTGNDPHKFYDKK